MTAHLIRAGWRQPPGSWALARLPLSSVPPTLADETSERGGVSPLALTLLTRSVSEDESQRRFPLFSSLTLRVTWSK